MKVLLVAVLSILASAHAEVLSDADRALLRSGVVFSLYTEKNPTVRQLLVTGDASSVASSNFDSSLPTRFITHGFMGNEQQSTVAVPRAAYITAGGYNVITVDWSSVQSLISPLTTVRNAGPLIAEFIDFLVTSSGLNPATTQLIGHSLGAHVISYAARTASVTVDAVIGLDPAGSDFENKADAIALGIQSGDASHVQIMHTNGGGMGLQRVAGDSDFYVNGGSSQPGCILDIVGICAHTRAALFFAETITNPTGFPTTEDSSIFLGGGTLSTNAKGVYSVVTGSNPPFALG